MLWFLFYVFYGIVCFPLYAIKKTVSAYHSFFGSFSGLKKDIKKNRLKKGKESKKFYKEAREQRKLYEKQILQVCREFSLVFRLWYIKHYSSNKLVLNISMGKINSFVVNIMTDFGSVAPFIYISEKDMSNELTDMSGNFLGHETKERSRIFLRDFSKKVFSERLNDHCRIFVYGLKKQDGE